MPDEMATQQLPPQTAHFAAIIRANLPDFRERYGVASLALFGSYVRGEQHAESDLDVLVEFSRQPTLSDLVGLPDALNALLQVKVDVVMRSTLKRRIGGVILREAIPL